MDELLTLQQLEFLKYIKHHGIVSIGAINLSYLKEDKERIMLELAIGNYIHMDEERVWLLPLGQLYLDGLERMVVATGLEVGVVHQGFFRRLSNSKFVLYTIMYGRIIIVKIWEILITLFIIVLSAYLGSGDHFDKIITFVKGVFK